MKIRLYLEEDSMSHALVRGLRSRGVDVTTALEEGMIQRTDEEHLQCATTMQRSLYSFNVADFFTCTPDIYLKALRTPESSLHASNSSRLASNYVGF